MLEFNENDFAVPPVIKEPVNHLGFYKIPMDEYRGANGLANSELQIFKDNPSSYIWNQTAPIDKKKATTADFGTSLHTSVLEPELYEDSVIISSTKGREAAAFTKDQSNNPDKIVLTSNEYKQIEIMTASAKCDPMFNRLLEAEGECEASIFVDDPDTGLRLKIRVDKIVKGRDEPLFCDLKSAASIDEWRADKPWLSPLFKFGYGFTASFYLYVGSIYYGVELSNYYFPVISKAAMLGRYPVSVFTISKEELIEYGFWQEMLDTLNEFADRKKNNNWLSFEKFPMFNIYQDDSVDIKFSDGP